MVRVYESSSSFTPEFKDDRLIIKLTVRLECDLNEIVEPKGEIDNKDYIMSIRRIIEEKVKEKTEHTFSKTQKMFESEPFGIKEKMIYYYPDLFKDKQNEVWEEIYESAELEIDVEVRIRRIGEIS